MDDETLVEVLKAEFKMLRRHRHLAKRPRGKSRGFLFLDFCRQHLLESHAQLFQDLWVLFVRKQHRAGYFVEFTRKDDPTVSTTRLLEQQYDWTGILSVPDRALHREENTDRTCKVHYQKNRRVALSSGAPELVSELLGSGTLMRAKQVTPDKSVSLGKLLRDNDAPAKIDYLSLNAKGSELSHLQSVDFGKHTIKMISVEHNFGPQREHIRRFLAEKGYRRQFSDFSKFDDWYVRTKKRKPGNKA